MGRKRKNQSPKAKKTDKQNSTKVLVGPIDSLFKRTHLKKEENTAKCDNDHKPDDIELIDLEENDSRASIESAEIRTEIRPEIRPEIRAESLSVEKLGVKVKASLCGETDLDTIIELIDEWISTEEELLDEDITAITTFFLDLATENDKEKIKEIVDHFYDSTSKREQSSIDWRTMYNEVIGLISSEFEELNFEFF